MEPARPPENPLASVRLFAGLSEGLRAELLERCARVRVPAGEWLFHAGEPGAAMYVVLSGRLEVVVEGPGAGVIRALDRGATAGELALLTGQPRSASVRARRDSELLELALSDFTELVESPAVALELLRALGTQLAASRALETGPALRPATVAVSGVRAGLPVEELCNALAERLAPLAPTALMVPGERGEAAAFGHELDRLEAGHEHVILCATAPPGDPWTAFCLRQADRRLVVVDGLPQGGEAAPFAGFEPLLLGSGPPRGALAAWLDALGAQGGFMLGSPPDAVIAGLARRIAGHSLGLVLSGGGARGLAHIGVLEELGAAGLEVDRVAGCSMGAVVGGLYAAGRTPAQIRAICREEIVDGKPHGDYTIPITALVRGKRAEAMGKRMFGDLLMEELAREFCCVSADLVSSELVLHRRGLVYERILASQALPGIFPPVTLDGRYLIDGGVLNNLPVEPMAATGEGPVIASDVSARFAVAGRPGDPGWRDQVRTAVTGLGAAVPFGIRDILTRSVVLGSIDTAEAAQRHADLVIEPEVKAIGLMGFEALDQAIEAGRAAARAALATWRGPAEVGPAAP